MSTDPRHAPLFEPITVGPKTFRNRFYVAPHCSGLGVEYPGAQAYLRGMRAEGGWAAVNTEYCAVDAESDDAPWVQARLIDRRDEANLSLMVDRVHEFGALAGVQLVYMGPDHTGFVTRLPAGGPSQMTSAMSGHSCYALDKNDIRRIQRSYVDAAIRARDLGFDLVQVAAREGFSLPLQFLWRYWNHRTDEYGGSIENRTRFWRETIEQVREAVGTDCAIVAGLCLDQFSDDSEQAFKVADDGVAVVELLDGLVDLWDMQVGHLEDDVSSSRFFEPFWQRSYIEQVRPYATKPIAAVGRFTDPELMARAVKDGVIDIIGAARPAIADPFIPTKIREGRADDIRECIGCNICVSRFNNGGGRIVCTQNATVGEEYRRGWHPERFNPSERAEDAILIVGAGPAGMECARVLGERGFANVHLVERETGIGGHVNWVSQLPGLRTWRRLVEYREAQLAKLNNVTVLTGTSMGVDDVLEYGAQTVVVATGADWDGSGTSPETHAPLRGAAEHPELVFTPEDLMVRACEVPGDSVLVYDCDGYFMGSSIAEKLAMDGKQVTLVSPADQIGSYLFFTDEGGHAMHALLELGVTLVPSHVVTSVRPGMITGHHSYHPGREMSWSADSIVLVTQRRSRNDLYERLTADPEALRAHDVERVLRIGDCVEPRVIAESVFDGHRLAREIDSPNPAEPLPFIREQRILGWHEEDYDGELRGLIPLTPVSRPRPEVAPR
ncbi:methylamine [Flexivirga endophytica]|jgi:NADH:flavin oxidoreductases, Old Yellow Enzyme family|uniref:Methylamine n=1 Tax=Flexivirga endophytica TaxID=1849103 RepID=A0A916SZH3_9MICO|nr:NAD(P)-binding protein [Flexivirga endophytica]GGB21438.1 methylamine [Flexivirga endophytica]GHB59095.1 methylamine [Flexivirga endophytica]